MDKLFNKYSLVARVYPALLVLAPVLWSSLVLFPGLISGIRNSTVSVLTLGCALYFLASIARSRGKRLETRLLAAWGAWPTTIFLRHSDSTIDPITKARYHRALETLGATSLPTPAQEAADPTGADHLYRSATKRLIELRRGKSYELVHIENESYGFRRNLLALKSTAVSLSSIAALATAEAWWTHMQKPVTAMTIAPSFTNRPYLPDLLLADVAYITLFLLVVSAQFVRQAADEYAYALLRTLDGDTQSSRPSRRKPRTRKTA